MAGERIHFTRAPEARTAASWGKPEPWERCVTAVFVAITALTVLWALVLLTGAVLGLVWLAHHV